MVLELLLFDDATARKWRPFTLTRPAGELRYGAGTLRERAEHVWRTRCAGHITAPHLASFDEPGVPPVVPPPDAPLQRDTLFLSSRLVLPFDAVLPALDGPATLVANGVVCGWYRPAGSAPPLPDAFLDPSRGPDDGAPRVDVAGRLLGPVWELVTGNGDQLTRDILARFPDAVASPRPELPAGVFVVGAHPLVIGRGVTIDPGVVFDLRGGPIWIEDGASISALSRVAGPAHVGPHTALLGGEFANFAAGPRCRLRGELRDSVVLGFTNKAHDGHIGHAYLGAWVNLGAMTTNSDLKNNYGTISVWTPDGVKDTGETKLGCLIGDHVKTAIGTVLNTGTVVGAGSNVISNGFPPKYIPPFRWGTGDDSVEYDLSRFLETAETVMARRNAPLSDKQRSLLAAAWQTGRSEV